LLGFSRQARLRLAPASRRIALASRTPVPPAPSLGAAAAMPGGLWVDKHRPNTLDKLVVHKDIGANLRNLVRLAAGARRASARSQAARACTRPQRAVLALTP